MAAPGYTYLTLGAARTELAARLEDPTYVYWTVPELNDLIRGAVRAWQALTGTYKQRATFNISPNGGIGGSAFYDLNQVVGFLNFSITDAQVINIILAGLLEPPLTPTWTGTGQYSFGQIVYALQNRINRWLEDTGANVTRNLQFVGTGPSASRIFLPEAVLDVRRAAWVRAVTSAVNVKDLGATGDGTTDDLAAINMALAQGGATGLPVYFPAGTYLVSAPLNAVGSSLTVYGDGPSSSVLRLGGPGPSLSSALLYFSGGASVTVHDLGLDGQHVQAPGLHLISVNTANVYNVAIRNFGTPGFSAGNNQALDGLYAAFVQTLMVTNSVITGNERSGIEMIPVANATISGNTISGNGYYAAAAEQDPGGASGPLNIQFLNNIAHNNGSGGFDVETGTGMPAAYGKIHGNDIQDCGNDMWGYGIGAVIGHNAYGEISGNTVHNFNQRGPQFPGYGTAVVATPSGPITLTGNSVSNTGDWGIVVNGTGGAATITGNSTSACPSGGLLANALSGAIIQYNYSYSNSGPDFQITACSGCITSPNFTTPPPSGKAPVVLTAKASHPVPAAISSPVYSTLWRDDEFAMQAFLNSGALAPADPPAVWGKFVMPPVGIDVYPPPLNPGQLETLVVTSGPQVGTTPFQVATSPTVLDIPEDFAWGVVFGALSDLFSADGPARDPDRAVYAEERYQESAELYRMNPTLLKTQINGVPIWSGSVFEMDSFLASWQASPGVPQFAGMCDRNLVAFGPVPNGVYSVTADVVGNIPVPVTDGDFLQVDRGALNPLIDYAFHLASYKMQGPEFHSTDKLRKNFYQAAALENSRLTRATFYRKAFELPAKRQQAEVPRI